MKGLIWYQIRCSRKNSKLLFYTGIALAVGVRIYIFRPMRMTNAILPGSPPWGNIKGRANFFSPSSRFPTGQQQNKPANITEHILFSLPPSSRTDQSMERAHSLSSLPVLLAAGQTSLHDSVHSLSSLPYWQAAGQIIFSSLTTAAVY